MDQFELKDVEVAVDGTSQDERDSTVDNFLRGKPTLSFIKKVDSVHNNEEVESLQNSECESKEESSSGSEKSGEGMKSKG